MSTKKLKIGFVLDDSLDKVDGVQQYVLTLGKWLADNGHEVHYLVGQTTRRDIGHIHSLSKNVAVRFNRNRMSIPLPASKKDIKQLLRREKFDVLHIQLPYSPWLAHRVIMAAGPQTAITGTFHIVPHSPLVRYAARVLAWWVRPSIGRFDKIISVSPAAADFAKAMMSVSTDILPNVVEHERFRSADGFCKYQDDVPTILFLGRLVPRKGCMLLLQAAAELRRLHPQMAFRVVICGKGPLEAELKHYAHAQNLDDIVEFTGFVTEEDKPRYLASADIAVFPSTGGESFGIVLIEAMAAGQAAILAGDNSGYSSVLRERPNLLFSPTDSHELATKLAAMITDKAYRKGIVKWERSYSKQFDVAVVGAKIAALYTKILRTGRDV